MNVLGLHPITINPYLQTGRQPSLIVPIKPPTTRLWVRNHVNGQFVWSRTATDFARVPVLAYTTHQRTTPALVGAAIEIGINATEEVRYQVGEAPLGFSLVLGDEFHDMSPSVDGYRIYVGLAFHF